MATKTNGMGKGSSNQRTSTPSLTANNVSSSSSSSPSGGGGATSASNNNDGSETTVPALRLVDGSQLTSRSSLRCGLCTLLIESPSFLPCATLPGASPHYYCRRCLVVHITVNGTCPLGCAPPSKISANGGGSESKNGSKPFVVTPTDVKLLCDTNKAAFNVFVDGVDVYCPFTSSRSGSGDQSTSNSDDGNGNNGCAWKGNYADVQTHLESKCAFYKR
jgi:hypothetical protein